MKHTIYLLGVLAFGLSACAYGSLGVDESAPVNADAADSGLREAGGSVASPPPGEGGPDASVSRPPLPEDSGIVDTGLPDQATSRDADAEPVADASDSGRAHDAGLPDAEPADAGDSGRAHDSGLPDANVPDANLPDANLPDANLPDGGTPTCASHGYSGVLVTFDLSGQPGSETSASPASTAAGVSSGVLARAAALVATGGSGSINSSGWATSASADPDKYYTFTVAPASGCTLTLASLSLDVSASATGPGAGDVATSADGFAQHAGAFAGTSSGQVAVAASRSAGPLEIRVYGYAASGSGGTLRIRNTMSLSGSID